MKLYKVKAILMLSFGMMFHSCLDLDPQDQLGDPTIWKKPNEFELFANQFYGWTRDFSNVVFDGSHSDLRSDLMTGAAYNEYSNGTNALSATDGNYTDAYKRIYYTNLLLQKAESYATPADIKRYVAEAKFFRAYCYFDLVQLYGDAIIVKKPLALDAPEMQIARQDRSNVIDFILTDLKEAAVDLPLANAMSSADEGRLSSGAVYAFLSRVALYEGTWQKSRGNIGRGKELLDESAKAALEVITSNQYALFKPEVLGDSAQKYLFILENEQSNPAGVKKSANKEYILSKRHDEIIAPIGKNITHTCVANAQYVTRKFAELYLSDNGLPIHHPDNKRFEGYALMNSEFRNRDNRMRFTLIVPGAYYWTNKSWRTTWLGDKEDLVKGKKYAPSSGSGYANQKWGAEREVADTKEGYDFPVIRYAEVLLNYAEAVFERDDQISDTDLNLSLNLVRLRVNALMPKLSVRFVAENGLDMREEIRRERTVELFGEGFRVDDLKRWKTAEIEMPVDMLGIKWKGTEFETKWNASYAKDAEGCLIIETGRKWDSRNYLLPIPSDQMQLNPNLGQNKGWGE